MKTNTLVLLVCLSLPACAPAGDEARPEGAREPIAAENPARGGEAKSPAAPGNQALPQGGPEPLAAGNPARAGKAESPEASRNQALPQGAPEPIAAENPARSGKEESLLEISERACAAAEKACLGCPNPDACGKALELALATSNKALRQTATGTDDLERRQAETILLAQRFDKLGKLAEECQ